MPGIFEQIHVLVQSSREGMQSHAFPRNTFSYISQVLTTKKKNLPHLSKRVLTVSVATERSGRTVWGTYELIYATKYYIFFANLALRVGNDI